MTYAMYVPQRFMGRTGYQIFVDRFYREGPPPERMEERILKKWSDEQPNWWPDADGEYRNQYFYGGNLKGIIAKLDYLQEIGVNLIYHSPISQTHSSHHYDVEDQTIIDPWIGTWKDYQELCREAHKRDILICPDLVFNHMGIQSSIFQEALHNPKSKYRDWFEWDEKGNPVFWYGFKTMPQCNKLNPDYQQYACDICEFYLKMGADGIRLDLGENFPKEFMRKVRSRIKAINPEALIVIEMWGLATQKENPQIYGEQTDSVMNYPIADAICRWIRYGNDKHFAYIVQELLKYPEQVQNVLWNFLDTHDTPRAMNMMAGEKMNENPFAGGIWDIENSWRSSDGTFNTFEFRKWEAENSSCLNQEIAQKRLILASLLQYFWKGIPVIYYGTEVGITGYKDPFNRTPYPWNYENKVLRKHYHYLGKLRKNNQDILSEGELTKMQVDESTLLLVRETGIGALIMVMNRSEKWQDNPIKDWNTKGWREIYNVQGGTKEALAPYGAIVYRVDN